MFSIRVPVMCSVSSSFIIVDTTRIHALGIVVTELSYVVET